MDCGDLRIYNDDLYDDLYIGDDLTEDDPPLKFEVNNVNHLIPDDLILQIIDYLKGDSLRKFCASSKRIKYVYERDNLFIINSETPEFLLGLTLNSLNKIFLLNVRMSKISKNNQFWYLKIERDFPFYINKYLGLKNKSYYAGIIYKDIISNSKDYYKLFTDYEKHSHSLTDEIKYKSGTKTILDALNYVAMGKIPINVTIKLLALSYEYTYPTLEKRLLDRKMELLCTEAVISSFFHCDTCTSIIDYGILTDKIFYACKYVTAKDIEHIKDQNKLKCILQICFDMGFNQGMHITNML